MPIYRPMEFAEFDFIREYDDEKNNLKKEKTEQFKRDLKKLSVEQYRQLIYAIYIYDTRDKSTYIKDKQIFLLYSAYKKYYRKNSAMKEYLRDYYTELRVKELEDVNENNPFA